MGSPLRYNDMAMHPVGDRSLGHNQHSELAAPTADCLVTQINTAPGKQVFDIAKTQRKAKMEPDGVLFDLGWKAMASI